MSQAIFSLFDLLSHFWPFSCLHSMCIQVRVGNSRIFLLFSVFISRYSREIRAMCGDRERIWRFARILTYRPLKKVPCWYGNRPVVDLSTADAPPWLILSRIFESTSYWRVLGTRRCPDPMPIFGVCTPGITVRVTSWTLWAGFQSRTVNFCDRDCIGNIAIVRKLRAVPYRSPMFLDDDAFGHAQRMFSFILISKTLFLS